MSTVADVVAKRLSAFGVEVAFSLASIHNLPLLDALVRANIRLVLARHEQGVVHMADGYSRVSGKVGVAITSTGPGAGNAMGALLEAYSASSRVLHFTGQIDSRFLDRRKGHQHEVEDQLSMLRTGSRRAYRVRRPEDALTTLASCFQYWRYGRPGPISVEIPIDIQSAPCDDPPSSSPIFLDPSYTSASLSAVAKLINSSKRPLIWAGGGAIASDCSQLVLDLVERTGAAVITTPNGRGVIPEDHPNCIGNFANLPHVRAFISEADCVLALGTNFDWQGTDFWRVDLRAPLIQIDKDPDELGRNYPVRFGIVGDCAGVLKSLVPLVSTRQMDESYGKDVRSARKDSLTTIQDRVVLHQDIISAVAEALPSTAVVVKDATIAAYAWANRLLPVLEPRSSIFASLIAIGSGLPLAIGAGIAAPDRRILVIAGDGGFVSTGFEFLTAVQENLPVSVLVFNDGGYGVLREFENEQLDGRRVGVDLLSPSFAAFASACGGLGFRPTNIEELRTSLEDAFRAARPSIIEIDMQSIFPVLPYTPAKPAQQSIGSSNGS
ncbi:MAG: thiamine pyrophosphate-binding protein [Dehalococcoidia bacterium]